MLALGVRYLNGFVAACEPDARERAEWPPHPGRVFMALAAAHFQTGMEPAEREALLWLQGDGEPRRAPAIRAAEAMRRAVVEHFVPVNDEAIWKKKDEKKKPPPPLQSAPGIIRTRQARTLARAWLDDDTVYLAWQDAEPPENIRLALEALCAKVTRLGHSSSLVQMWVAEPDEIGEPNWVPDDDRAAIHLRVAGPGTIEDLERRYNRQVRPEISFYQGYARPTPRGNVSVAPGTVFSPHLIVLTLEPKAGPYRQLDLLCVLTVAQRWREALLSHSNDLPERVRHVVSGHDRDGAPLSEPHLAFVPLAFVGHPHADGHLLAMAIALPEGLGSDERRDVLRVVGRVHELKLGRLGVWSVQRDTSARPPWNLRPEAWTADPEGATHWSTVTPVAFDRHPKAKDRTEYQRELAGMIAAACESIDLPRPREVIVTSVSAHLGVPPAHAFPRLRRKDDSERRHAHAILVFDRPVRGPMLLGAGRYRGYGVCRPVGERRGEA
jgi:CRISPR-associated protein Csb2